MKLYNQGARPVSRGTHKVSLGVQHAKLMLAYGVSASELREASIAAQSAREAGWTAAKLLAAGVYSVGYSAQQLQEAGVSASALVEANYDFQQLRSASTNGGRQLSRGATGRRL